jgi:hypothetical protein
MRTAADLAGQQRLGKSAKCAESGVTVRQHQKIYRTQASRTMNAETAQAVTERVNYRHAARRPRRGLLHLRPGPRRLRRGHVVLHRGRGATRPVGREGRCGAQSAPPASSMTVTAGQPAQTENCRVLGHVKSRLTQEPLRTLRSESRVRREPARPERGPSPARCGRSHSMLWTCPRDAPGPPSTANVRHQ